MGSWLCSGIRESERGGEVVGGVDMEEQEEGGVEKEEPKEHVLQAFQACACAHDGVVCVYRSLRGARAHVVCACIRARVFMCLFVCV